MLLPEFLRHQLLLGLSLSRQLDTREDLVDAAQQCLNRDPSWIAYYQSHMEELEGSSKLDDDTEELLEMTQAEVLFGHAMWVRDYAAAAKALQRTLDSTFAASRPTGAWHALWLGYSYDLLGDTVRAHELYDRAHRAENNIPPFNFYHDITIFTEFSPQVHNVANSLQRGSQAHLELPKLFDIEMVALDGTGTVPQIEAALEALGEYVGLASSRPDNEYGSGPDVLWSRTGGPALSVEAKTGKGTNAVYTKDDLGQIRDHRQWIREDAGPIEIYSAFVGPVAPASSDANPDPDIVVIGLEEFRKLRDRLRAALMDICASAVPATALKTVHEVFTERDLIWPDLYRKLQKHVLRDIPSKTT